MSKLTTAAIANSGELGLGKLVMQFFVIFQIFFPGSVDEEGKSKLELDDLEEDVDALLGMHIH